MKPSVFAARWLAASATGSVPTLEGVLNSVGRSGAQWALFWRVYLGAHAGAGRGSHARQLALDQRRAAEAALARILAPSRRLRAVVARTRTPDYWLALFGGAASEAAARRQARYIIAVRAPGWATRPHWRSPTVSALVKEIVRSQDFSVMPILADALQDAGCDDSEWLRLMRAAEQPWFVGAGVLDALG